MLPKHSSRNVCAVIAENDNVRRNGNERINGMGNSTSKGFSNRGNGKFNSNRKKDRNDLDYNNNRTFDTSGNKYCAYCGEVGHMALRLCEPFKKVNVKSRYDFVFKKRWCWRCFSDNHFANCCTDINSAVASDCKRGHSDLVCRCKFDGKKIISSAAKVCNLNMKSPSVGCNACMPVLPVRISTPNGNKIVYALINSGSQEILVSKKAV